MAKRNRDNGNFSRNAALFFLLLALIFWGMEKLSTNWQTFFADGKSTLLFGTAIFAFLMLGELLVKLPKLVSARVS